MEKTLVIISLILVVINFIILFLYIQKVKKYQKMYENTLAKFNNTANVKDKFVELFSRLEETEKQCEETKKCCENTNDILSKTIKRTGLVKYNAYDDTDNKLSFALAMLDDDSNGILLNHVYSKHGSSIYAKKVDNGKVIERISEEEAYALEQAMGNCDMKELESQSIKKVKTANIHKVRKAR